MNSALRRIFWGYLFIFFRIHIGIDVLMDPIGYMLIFSGCARIVDEFPQAKKAMSVAIVGSVLSIPSVVVNLSDPTLPYSWSMYGIALFLMKILIAFYLFIVLTDIVATIGKPSLIVKTRSTFKIYIGFHLFAFALQSFYMNTSGAGWVVLNVLSAIGVLIMDILFLLLLRKIRNAAPSNPQINYLL